MIAVVAWGSAVLAIALAALARPPVDEGMWYFVVDVTVAAVYGTVAGVVLARRVHPVGWLLALAAVGGGVAAVGYATRCGRAGARAPGPRERPPAAEHRLDAGDASAVHCRALAHPRPPAGPARSGVVVGVVPRRLVLRLPGRRRSGPRSSPVIVPDHRRRARRRRGRRMAAASRPGGERNGLGWIGLGTALIAHTFVPLVLPCGALPTGSGLNPFLHLMSQAVYPVAILVAVLRGRMWGLRLAVSRTVLAGTLTVALARRLRRRHRGRDPLVPGSGGAPAIAAGFVALGVQPVRAWLAAARPPPGLRRRRGARSRRPHAGPALRRAETAEDLLEGLAAGVGVAMRLESVSVHAPGGDAVVWGMRHGHPVEVALGHRGEYSGTSSSRRRGGESLGTRTHRTLTELAAVVATPVAVTQAAEKLQETRAGPAAPASRSGASFAAKCTTDSGPRSPGSGWGSRGPGTCSRPTRSPPRNCVDPPGRARPAGRRRPHPLPQHVPAGARRARAGRRRSPSSPPSTAADSREGAADLRPEGLGPAEAAAAYGIVAEAVVNAPRTPAAATCTGSTVERAERLHVIVPTTGAGSMRPSRAGVGDPGDARACRGTRRPGRRALRSPDEGRWSRRTARQGASRVPHVDPGSPRRRPPGVPARDGGLLGDPARHRRRRPGRRVAEALAPSCDGGRRGADGPRPRGGLRDRGDPASSSRRNPRVRVLVVTMREDDESVVACMRVGRPWLPPQGRDTRRGGTGGARRRQRRGSVLSARPSRPGPSPP